MDMKSGRVYRYLADDHRRLEELLRRATSVDGIIESGAAFNRAFKPESFVVGHTMI